MPKKSVINRGRTKIQKLFNTMISTIKARYPTISDDEARIMAIQGVLNYAVALGYYEGVWRGAKAYLDSKGVLGSNRAALGGIRSVVIKVARLIMAGASDEEIAKTIEGSGIPDTVKTALKEYFLEAGKQNQK